MFDILENKRSGRFKELEPSNKIKQMMISMYHTTPRKPFYTVKYFLV